MAGRSRRVKGKTRKAKGGGGGQRRIRGRGNYQVGASGADSRDGVFAKLDRALRRIPRGTFAGGGAAVGKKYGGRVGAGVGRVAGAGMAAISGYGNYSVAGNSLSRVSTSMDMVPQFVKNEHSIRVKHREFIKDLVVPGNGTLFDLQDYVINPANRDLFPWLGQMARQYSQYKIHGMVFAFKSMSSDYAASGPLGTVMMATNYNALDRVFANKVELENTEFAVSTKPSMSLVHAIECDPKVSGFDILYIRDPGYDTGEVSDRRFYDYGRFQIATSGLPGASASTLGELWVSYDIELIKPIIGGIYTTAVSVVSNQTGVAAVGVPSGVGAASLPNIVFTDPQVQLLGSEVFNTMPGVSAVATGAVALNGNVVSLSAIRALTIKKNGYYNIIVGGEARTTATRFALPDAATTNSVNSTVVKFGNAYYNAATPTALPFDPEFFVEASVPHAVTTTAGGSAYSYSLCYQLRVAGISAATDYITFSLSNLTAATAATTIVSEYSRQLSITWIALGVNEQVSSYMPVDLDEY